jgi:predicted GH43/DUF377 family glycosyl hydrolase
LIEIAQNRAAPIVEKGRVVRVLTLRDIDSEPDESEGIWQHDAIELDRRGYTVRSLAEYQEEIPSIIEQRPWQVGFLSLPSSPTRVHFNPGLVRTLNSSPETKSPQFEFYLVTRRWTRQPQGQWLSDLVVWSLDDDFYPVNPIELKFSKTRPGQQREDPRVVLFQGRFLVSYAHWLQGRIYTAQQAFSWFSSSWGHISTFSVAYGGNGWSESLSGSGHEKNWQPFFHDGVLHIVYSVQPHVVLRLDTPTSLKKYETRLDYVPWSYGELRGGTPPIRIGKEYITFPHSAHAWKAHQKRYVSTVLAFEAKPPFRITRLCSKPLFQGSDLDRVFLKGPPAAYATGAVLQGEEILLVGGACDERCFIARIPWSDLDKLLLEV